MSDLDLKSRRKDGSAAGITPLKARGTVPSRSASGLSSAPIPEDAPADEDELVLPSGEVPEGDRMSRESRNSYYAFAEFDITRDCQICAESLENPESPELQGAGGAIVKLMCKHSFHQRCIEEFRAFGVNSVCKICRTKLPFTPERQFDDASSLYWPIHNRVDKGLALWSALGRRERRDMDEVARLWLSAAEAGLMHGQHNIGCLYAQGNGVPQSDETAVSWFRKAADQGEMHAMYDLARMFVLGRGVPQSDEEAAKWYCEAATQGHVNAQFNLAALYSTGRGVAKSDEEAMKWFGAAADQGDDQAREQLERIAANLNSKGSKNKKKK